MNEASSSPPSLLPNPPVPTTVRHAVAALEARLGSAGIEDATLEAQVLVMHALRWDRVTLLCSPDEKIPASAMAAIEASARRREMREPLAYITGHREFFGLDLMVDRRVLVPRQETECLVEQVLAIVAKHYPIGNVSIADVGTGSGAIAIALASHILGSRIYAIDQSPDALEVAAANVRRRHVEGQVLPVLGDLMPPLPEPIDIVVANLPYIPEGEWGTLQPEIRIYEPPLALLGGTSGLDLVGRLLRLLAMRDDRPGWVVLELGEGQAAEVVDLAQKLFPLMSGRIYQDLQGLDRGVVLSGLEPI